MPQATNTSIDSFDEHGTRQLCAIINRYWAARGLPHLRAEAVLKQYTDSRTGQRVSYSLWGIRSNIGLDLHGGARGDDGTAGRAARAA